MKRKKQKLEWNYFDRHACCCAAALNHHKDGVIPDSVKQLLLNIFHCHSECCSLCTATYSPGSYSILLACALRSLRRVQLMHQTDTGHAWRPLCVRTSQQVCSWPPYLPIQMLFLFPQNTRFFGINSKEKGVSHFKIQLLYLLHFNADIFQF